MQAQDDEMIQYYNRYYIDILFSRINDVNGYLENDDNSINEYIKNSI
jgi:hypothetical protein